MPMCLEMTEQELIAGLKARDEEAVAALLDVYWTRAYHVARTLCGGDPGAAEDVAQEAFVAAVNAIDRFEEGRPFRPWFFRILERLAARHRRGAGRRVFHEGIAVDREAPRREGGATSAATDAASQEEAALVREHLARVKPIYRHALALRYLEGMELREVADVLEIPEGTVSSRIRRGLEELQRSLEPVVSLGSIGAVGAAIAEAWVGVEAPAAPSVASVLTAASATLASEGPAGDGGAPAGGGAREASRGGTAAGSILALALIVPMAIAGMVALLSVGDPSTTAPTGRGPSHGSTDLVDRASTGGGVELAGDRGESAGGAAAAPSDDDAGAAAGGPDRAAPARGIEGRVVVPEPRTAWVKPIMRDLADRSGWARDNDAAAAIGRLFAGWNVPEDATRVGEDGRFSLELPAGEHLIAVGARGCATEVHRVTAPVNGRAFELAYREPGRARLRLVDHLGMPYLRTSCRLGLVADEGGALLKRLHHAPLPADADSERAIARALLEGLKGGGGSRRAWDRVAAASSRSAGRCWGRSPSISPGAEARRRSGSSLDAGRSSPGRSGTCRRRRRSGRSG